MTISNYTLQDLIGILAGFVLFGLIFIPSGYVIGHTFNFFDFKDRRWFVRLGFALLISVSITPVLLFLAYRLISELFAVFILVAMSVFFLIIILRRQDFSIVAKEIKNDKNVRTIFFIVLLWMLLVTILLVDIQFGDKLYFNITAFDYQTRVSVINAITRTGVPPLNPSYHPGEPVKLTFLYYFWYILCSLVDKLGGDVVDSRTSLMASTIWAGLAMMATIALYLRIRNSGRPAIWRSTFWGIGLLAVSGLDIFGSFFYMTFPQLLYGYVIDGDIEHWNEQITAWIGSTLWTPHHLVSLLNCVLGVMLVACHKNSSNKLSAAVVAGIAFASAFGLSSWVTLIFIFLWAVWVIVRLLGRESINSVSLMFVTGVVAAIVISPFILDLYGGGSGSSAGFPLGFDVRIFRPALILTSFLPHAAGALTNLILLPLNYFLELGFYMLAGILWYRLVKRERIPTNKFTKLETILLVITVLLTSFTRSTLISNNDFGWRGWLPGQFVLLIWGTDVLVYLWKNKPINFQLLLVRRPGPIVQVKYSVLILIALGVVTSLQDAFFLRAWPVLIDYGILKLSTIGISNQYQGTKNFEARALYSLIENKFPAETIVQFNPLVGLDRPSGLYRSQPTVVSYHALYGVSPDQFRPLAREISEPFTTPFTDWSQFDEFCSKYGINVIIFSDTDKAWEEMPYLIKNRQSIFNGKHYSTFECRE